MQYRFDVTCPECGHDLDHRVSGEALRTITHAEAWCSECLTVWQITALVSLLRTDRALCQGTDEARRRRAGEALGGLAQAVFE